MILVIISCYANRRDFSHAVSFFPLSQSALCRATVAQGPSLIARMGANTPAAVPSLARGCLVAYQKAAHSKSKNHAIAQTSRRAIRALARLSRREQSRIRTMLEQDGVMIDVQLKLAMDQDTLAACCLLIQELDMRGSERGGEGDDLKLQRGDEERVARMRSLLTHLSEDADLLLKTLRLLANDCNAFDNDMVTWARLCFTLAACSWTLCRVPIHLAWENSSVRDAFAALVAALDAITDRLSVVGKNLSDSATESHLDRAYNLLVCALVSTLMAIAILKGSSEQTMKEKRKCARSIEKALRVLSFSRKSATSKSTFVYALMCHDPTILCATMETILITDGRGQRCSFSRDPSIVAKATETCLFSVKEGLFDVIAAPSTDRDDILADQSAILAYLQNDTIPVASKANHARDALSVFLFDEPGTRSFLRNPSTAASITAAMRILLQNSPTRVPFLMPVSMENLVARCPLRVHRLEATTTAFLLPLLYCFEFMEAEPFSPFLIDPRAMPLKEIFMFCDSASPNQVHALLSGRLKALIKDHCPEIPFQSMAYRILCFSRHLIGQALTATLTPHQRKKRLEIVLRESLQNRRDDPSGCGAERAFVSASVWLSDADLFTTAVSVLLSKSREPSLFFTYSMLYRDPLLILKCPLDSFERRGWRRIAVHILSTVSETNDWVAEKCANGRGSLLEYSSSRNQVLIRSLIPVLCGDTPAFRLFRSQCSMTVGLTRRILAEGRGAPAMFIKQMTSDSAIDWLVENVPEVIADRAALVGLLSDRGSMTATERLVAADAVLRIAVVQGHRYESEAILMAYAALSQFIASFFLVIGPVGVPVNTLVSEGSGADATKVSRKAAFRILKALLGVPGYRSKLRNECGLCLQKLAGLCKGESIVTSLPSATANRQKSLLKELLLAIQKAGDSMGSGSQL